MSFNLSSKFIVFEGIDGSGKTTVSKQVVNSLNMLGITSMWTCEPTASKLGNLFRLNQYSRKLSPYQQLSILTTDRFLHIREIIDYNLNQNINVICDRYYYSNIVYQSITENLSMHTIELFNKDFRKPDCVIYIDVPPTVCYDRLKQRDLDKNHESLELLEKLHKRYQKVSSHHNFTVVNGNQKIENIVKTCISIIKNLG